MSLQRCNTKKSSGPLEERFSISRTSKNKSNRNYGTMRRHMCLQVAALLRKNFRESIRAEAIFQLLKHEIRIAQKIIKKCVSFLIARIFQAQFLPQFRRTKKFNSLYSAVKISFINSFLFVLCIDSKPMVNHDFQFELVFRLKPKAFRRKQTVMSECQIPSIT